jgi:subtilisin family serine protease
LFATGLAMSGSPNDPLFTSGQQWGLNGSAGISAPSAWPAATGGGVIVGDVDTGADFNNPDLAGKLIPGARLTSQDGTVTATGQAAVQDDNCSASNSEYGHGSMTTGIMVAATNNGRIMAGVAPDAMALVVKVLDSSGSGADVDVANGIIYAANHGARVINLSIGPTVPTITLSGDPSAVGKAIVEVSNTSLVVVAAGNNGTPFADYPGASDVALVVGAVGPAGEKGVYSTTGGVNIWAPGGDDPTLGSMPSREIYSTVIVSCDRNGYNYAQGTSMAAPHVAGVAALLAGAPCNLSTPAAIRNQILATARAASAGPEADAGRAVATCHGASAGGGRPGPSSGTGGSRPEAGGAPGSSGAAGRQALASSPSAPPTSPSPSGGAVAQMPTGEPGAGTAGVPGTRGSNSIAAPIVGAIGLLVVAVAGVLAALWRRRRSQGAGME